MKDADIENRRKGLKALVAELQNAVIASRVDKEGVSKATKQLHALTYTYDFASFPVLGDTHAFKDTSGTTPSNLAEALLWKLGRWKSYKKFAANYAAKDPVATKQDVVFFAFAQHLKDRSNPIYDQHALRALWAICGHLSPQERAMCKSQLFDSKNKWKSAGYGMHALQCYEFFVNHINRVMNGARGLSKDELDRLLMPLGQAIKELTNSYAEFCDLCGWPAA